jgi:hypothetical protein
MPVGWFGWEGDAVPDHNPVIADQDLPDEPSYHALTLDYVESFGRRAQTGEKPS